MVGAGLLVSFGAASWAVGVPPGVEAPVATASPSTVTREPTESRTLAATVAPTPPPLAEDGTALALLEQLPIRPEADGSTYSRDAFGSAWIDMDHNGCDTRNDILARDLINDVFRDSCVVSSGTLISAYTGATIEFIRGQTTSSKVQIDHVVALADAWRTGAEQLSMTERELLANDPLNLQAIEGALNASKSDQDAAEWLPPLEQYRCVYVARQVSVKYLYRLWVTPTEFDAMHAVLRSCPNQQRYSSPLLTR